MARFSWIPRFRTGDWRGRSGAVAGVIGPELKVVGEVQCDGTIVIDGVVEGAVFSRRVMVNAGAFVAGSILAESISINGSVAGPVEAIEVSIAKGARVSGTITHHKLSIEPGAIVEGLRPWRPLHDWE